MSETQAGEAKKPMNKTEILNALAESTGLSKQQVGQLLDELGKLIGKNLSDGGPGEFTVPNLLKIHVVRKAAQPERTGINPITKQEQVFKAKPASNSVRVRPLKGLKDMAQPSAAQ